MAKIFVAFNNCNYLCIYKQLSFFYKLGVLSSSLLLKLIKYITTTACCFVHRHSFSTSTLLGNTTTSNPGSAWEAEALLISLFVCAIMTSAAHFSRSSAHN